MKIFSNMALLMKKIWKLQKPTQFKKKKKLKVLKIMKFKILIKFQGKIK